MEVSQSFLFFTSANMDVIGRLTPMSFSSRIIRRMSGSQDDFELEMNHPPMSEYFQEIYDAEHPEQIQSSHSPGVLEGIKERLSPAGAAIGQVIRRLSQTEANIREELPEYLRELNQTGDGQSGCHLDSSSDKSRRGSLVADIRQKIGSAVRTLSTFENGEYSKLSVGETFRHFLAPGGERKVEEEPFYTGLVLPVLMKDTDVTSIFSKKKKKKSFRELFIHPKVKRQV